MVEPVIEGGEGYELLDILDQIESHYGDSLMDILERWTWKIFCARWARMVDYARHEKTRRDTEQREREFEQQRRATEAEHREALANAGLSG